ncbi:MAG: hypothetical protein JKY92_06485 [Magnetovibrio sp.]|nr:hypothetical protein [Magnetovibrio sp.]
MTAQTNPTAHEKEIDELKGKLILAALISIPNIIVMNPTLVPGVAQKLPAGSYIEGLAWSIMALISVPVFMWAGSHLYIGALARLKQGSFSLETIAALALALASAYSLAIAIVPGFDSLAPTAHPLWDFINVAVAASLIIKISQAKKVSAVPETQD